MLEHLKKVGPVFLVFGVWFFTFLALFRVPSGDQLIFPMMIIMDIMLIAFYLGTREEMKGKVLRQWRKILLVGLIANLIGTIGFIQSAYSEIMRKIALYSWMVLPGVGYIQTWKNIEYDKKIYLMSGLTTLSGFLLFALIPETLMTGSKSIGLNLVLVGQTAGIAFAALKNVRS